ncbi:uncharacterized protein LOC127352652 [Dicentrarchus labrax]|uniref:uncharacterized protein LOC127352652 n=1 Tax=Dicentrarchus labrax TaxID=13489 RepID=UPI0021F64898|nr:uncharacterized protein LOC127352652 [Dicentrarchus labrax]
MKKSRRDFLAHRQDVRIRKSKMLVNATHIAKFIKKASEEIPAALVTLERNPTVQNLEMFYGLLSGYIICTTGHRRGVVTNMTVREVLTAESASDGRRIIRVKEHKTKEVFGYALVPLNNHEYMWFYRFVYHRRKYPCGNTELVFANTNGGSFRDALVCFQKAWQKFDLPGKPTFMLIRSSISTLIGSSLGTQEKTQVHRMMCHSDSTAEKFYEADLTLDQAFKCRSDTANALAQKLKSVSHLEVSMTEEEQSESSEDEDKIQTRGNTKEGESLLWKMQVQKMKSHSRRGVGWKRVQKRKNLKHR